MSMLQISAPIASIRPPVMRSSVAPDEVWPLLAHLAGTYPGFRTWFWDTFAAGIPRGERRAFVHEGQGRIDGVVLAKADSRERKLCTIWVAPHARGRRIASDLVEEACDWLEDPLPLLTVPEERLAELTPLMRARGFQPTEALPSCYRAGRVEHVFNGRLIPRAFG